MDGWIPGPTSSAASPSRRSCSKLALPWVSFGLQKFEHDDVIALRARGTKSPLPSSSRNQTIGRIPEGSHAATAVDHATNLLSSIYGQIYFPTYSNGLKEITRYLGFRWSGSLTSGLETIVWRDRWEASRDPALKRTLLDYNRQDCEALELVANSLVDLHRAAPPDAKSSQREVVLTSDIKRESPYGFKRNEFVFPEMETINKAAYWDYQRERVYVKSRHKSAPKRKRHATRQNALLPNTTIKYSRPSCCPTCKSKLIYGHGKRSRTVTWES
jgi:hypothetical protein